MAAQDKDKIFGGQKYFSRPPKEIFHRNVRSLVAYSTKRTQSTDIRQSTELSCTTVFLHGCQYSKMVRYCNNLQTADKIFSWLLCDAARQIFLKNMFYLKMNANFHRKMYTAQSDTVREKYWHRTCFFLQQNIIEGEVCDHIQFYKKLRAQELGIEENLFSL